MSHNRAALQHQAEHTGADKKRACVVTSASRQEQSWFRTIVTHTDQLEAYGDAILLTEPGQASVMQTRDCPTIVFANERTGEALTGHFGRPQQSPGCCDHGFLGDVMHVLFSKQNWQPNDTHALLVAGICKEHFTHEDPGANIYTDPYAKYTGIVSGETRQLDLVGLLRQLLVRVYDIPVEQVMHDGVCTFADQRLSSYRRRQAGLDTEDSWNSVITTLPRQ